MGLALAHTIPALSSAQGERATRDQLAPAREHRPEPLRPASGGRTNGGRTRYGPSPPRLTRPLPPTNLATSTGGWFALSTPRNLGGGADEARRGPGVGREPVRGWGCPARPQAKRSGMSKGLVGDEQGLTAASSVARSMSISTGEPDEAAGVGPAPRGS